MILLVAGAEVLVRGAARLAAIFGISPLVIGLTVVAFATSAPELAVSVRGAWAGETDLALGNVIGSNLFNILLILGVSALIVPLVVDQRVLRADVPVLIGASVIVWALSGDGRLDALEGGLLLAGLLLYVGLQIRSSRSESVAVREEYEREYGPRPATVAVDVVRIAGGLLLLVLGARWFVDAAVTVARALGVSELVVGLTIVAAGTSLPEAATSLVAALRGERDIAVGNAVGSSTFNLLGVLGLAAFLCGGIPVAAPAFHFDMPLMTATAVACLPICFTGYRIARWEGALFVGYYAAYLLYVVLDAVGHDALPVLSGVLGMFVVPLTVITLGVLTIRSLRDADRGA